MLLAYRALHRKPRGRRTVAVAAAAGSVALGLALPGSPPAAASTTSTPCRQPVVRDVMVSQGLPSYTELTRGKTALVKFFLSERSSTECSNVTSETVAITGGRLTVHNGSPTPPVISLDVPTSGILPEFSSYEVAPVTSTPSDPRFVVNGAHLTSADPTHADTTFPVSFSAVLDYVTRDRKGVAVETSSITVTQRPGGAPLTATVSKPVKPLRLLVVPMGDADATTPAQFPSAAATEVGSGIASVARTLPVADGTGSLTSTAGLRWHLSTGMVDLGPHTETDPATGVTETENYMPDGKYCGGGSSFDYVQKQLTGFRSAWNAENPAAPVDRVLGVVWRDVSVGDATGDGPGCAEGYAALGGTVAWARVVPTSSTRNGITGSLTALELTHTFGGSVVSVTQSPSGPQPGTAFPHSFSSTADRTAPNRAYNVPQRAFLDSATNRSTTAYARAPWDDYSTLYEKADWNFVQCFLASSSSTASRECGSPVSTGSVSAAGGSYVLGGTTDGTAAGTDAHTYFDADMPQDGTDPASTFRLLQRDAADAPIGPSTGVRVSAAGSEHDDGGSDHVHLDRHAFEVAIPQQPGATVFELWKGEPGSAGAVQLLRRALDGQAPVIVTTETTSAPGSVLPYTSDGASRQPALSRDGKMVAFSTRSGLRVARAGTTSPGAFAEVAGEQAAWRADGQQLAIVRGGEVWLVDVVLPDTGAPVLSNERKVYGSRVGPTPPASRPTYLRNADELGVSINGDLFAINLRLLTPDAYPVLCPLDALVQDSTATGTLACRRLTATPEADTAATFSPDRDLLAFARTADGGAGAIWTLDPRTPGTSVQSRLATKGESYGSPAWAGSRLLAVRSAGLVAVDAKAFDGLTAVSGSAGDTWPSATADGKRVVFARPSGSASDLYTFGGAKRSASATVQDDNPQDLRLDLYVVCDGEADPQQVAVRPSSVDAAKGQATFDLRFDTSRTCADGQLLYRATDGYQVTRKLGEPVVGTGAASAAIYLPKPAAVVLQYDPIQLAGAGKSASGAATDQIAWTLTGPGYSRSLGVGTVLPDVVAPAAGWTAGTWTVTAVPDGDVSAAQQRVFTIVADTDGDGIPDSRDTRAVHTCFPEDAASSAANALADPDGDLVVSLLDEQPCTSSMNASVDFDPNTVNLGSSGNPITLRMTTKALDVSKVQREDVVISQVAGLTAQLQAESIVLRPGAVLEAKFPRQQFIDFFRSHGLSGYVPVVLSATRAGMTARGFDPAAPLYQPS